MKKFTVTCYSPPSALEIKKKDIVEVEGWLRKENIRAERITNKDGPTCQCEPLKAVMEFIPGLPIWVTKKGVVTKVLIDKDFIQFELVTEK